MLRNWSIGVSPFKSRGREGEGWSCTSPFIVIYYYKVMGIAHMPGYSDTYDSVKFLSQINEIF